MSPSHRSVLRIACTTALTFALACGTTDTTTPVGAPTGSPQNANPASTQEVGTIAPDADAAGANGPGAAMVGPSTAGVGPASTPATSAGTNAGGQSVGADGANAGMTNAGTVPPAMPSEPLAGSSAGNDPANDPAAGNIAQQDPAAMMMDAGLPPATGGDNLCGLPAVADYGAPGPFDDVQMFPNVGPGGNYTMYRPTASLGRDGVKHPIAIWGNGIATTPDMYQTLLKHVASHGIVVLCCNDTMAERPCLNSGMDWLVAQNESGELAGKLNVERELTVGYSWGGGAAIDTANRPNVAATASIHGMPPRGTSAFADMHAPLLLFTSTGDTFVNAQQYVTPNYQASQVPTFYATLNDAPGHLYPLDPESLGCSLGPVFTGESAANVICAGAEKERAPLIAWMRLWACEDEAARSYFYGPSCVLCESPWTSENKPEAYFQ